MGEAEAEAETARPVPVALLLVLWLLKQKTQPELQTATKCMYSVLVRITFGNDAFFVYSCTAMRTLLRAVRDDRERLESVVVVGRGNK
jgi:hypothetical protein